MELLRNMSLEKLVEIFELTSNMNDENIPTVTNIKLQCSRVFGDLHKPCQIVVSVTCPLPKL